MLEAYFSSKVAVRRCHAMIRHGFVVGLIPEARQLQPVPNLERTPTAVCLDALRVTVNAPSQMCSDRALRVVTEIHRGASARIPIQR